MKYKQTPYLIESGEATKHNFEKMGWDFVMKWEKKFLEKKIVTQGIITKDTIPVIQAMPNDIKQILRQRPATVRVIDEKELPFSINLYLIYPDNVFILVPQQSFVLTVENKFVYDSLVTMYKTLFEKAEVLNVENLLDLKT